MACYHPIPCRKTDAGDVILHPQLGTSEFAVPCGTCVGCRQDRATHWAHRSTHEASQWPANTFLTLTYDDKHLPPEGQLDAAALQRFIKRLRQHARRHRGCIAHDPRSSPRYLACGEYGETTGRPHYHPLLFNCGFTDRRRVGGAPDKPLYENDCLLELWPYGGHRFGDADAGAAGNYVAKYILKKQLRTGLRRLDDGTWINRDGEICPAPPFIRMSLKPAIGNTWLQKYATDLRHGYLVTQGGRKQTIPRAYLKRLERDDPELLAEIRAAKERHLMNTPSDQSDPARLAAAEVIHLQKKERKHL